MADRDESNDIATYLDCGVRDWCDWGELERGAKDIVRYVPHSDLEAAELRAQETESELLYLRATRANARDALIRAMAALEVAIVCLPSEET